MGIGLRVFLVDDDDSIRTLPVARYERLHEGERLPEYASKRVRCAEVGVEFYMRKPMGIIWTNFHILPLDSEGRIDAAEMKKQDRLSAEAHPLLPEENRAGQVINARRQFSKRRYDHRYRWNPTEEILKSIEERVLNK
jgi:hypothetical protein